MPAKPEWLIRIEKEKKKKSGILDLSKCELKKVPNELLQMEWLIELNLSSNNIVTIENLQELRELEILLLYFNQIKKIENLDSQKKLTGLYIDSNKIEKIENIEHLGKLTHLALFSNQITRIENLEGLGKIEVLYLDMNQIENIENLNHLTNLISLTLSRNKIHKIENLGCLKNTLQKLDLSDNEIEQIENIEMLDKLEEIYLNRNKIKKLEGLKSNTLLSTLDLYENEISDPVTELKYNTSLTWLGLSNNNITDISVLNAHIKLKELYLSQNPLHSIAVLEQLPNLERIVLSNTGLKTLKPLLPAIAKGITVKTIYGFEDKSLGIFIKDNDQLDIPKQIIEQGNDAIIQFYQLQQNKSHALDEIYLNEAKLILVGEGKVGKTSLRVKLIDTNADLPKDDERTRGIDIDDYSFRLKNQETYKAHIWDFGGQNIQYALHRFFMTENSLYILMTESRNERDKNFMYWFQNIDLFGGKDSPILIVMNLMHGDRGANIDIASYVSEFKKIVNNEILEVNLLKPQQDDGLQKLRTIIEQQLENLPHIRKPIFRCWLDVREALQEEANKNPYISIERYQQICIEKGVEEPYFELVGRYLHNLGIVLWYHDKEFLQNKMILNPLWAISAIYKIIDDKKIQDNKGKFDNDDKNRLWSDASYKFSKDELTSLLKVFKICFQRFNLNKNEYIVPALMEANPPAIAKDWDNTGCRTVTFEYIFMPRGIANQLTADLHQHIQDELNHVWAYGVVLHYAEDTDTMAMIVENTYNRRISIDVKGNYANRFMGIIIQELKNINNSYIGLKSEMKIPCTCNKCKTLNSPQLYTEQDLLEKLKENKTEVYCNKLDDKVDIQPVLESIGITHPVFDKLKRRGGDERINELRPKENTVKKKVFISYSHAQCDYIKIFTTDLRSYLRTDGIEFEIFDDAQIPVGTKWDEFLQNEVAKCDLMILLVSQEFMNSTYIKKKEFGSAVERLKIQKNILIVPVYFTPCFFDSEDELKDLQFFKPNGSDYGHANIGTGFSYIDLITFRATDGMAIPNANRQRYMLDFVKKLKEKVVEK